MPRNVRPLFSTDKSDFSFSESAGASDINGVLIKNDDPPSAQQVGSIAINNDGTGGAVVITVKCQLYFGSAVGYGTAHGFDTALTFNADADTTVEANLYEQSWWKENEGFRIVLSRASSTSLSGNAVCIIK